MGNTLMVSRILGLLINRRDEETIAIAFQFRVKGTESRYCACTKLKRCEVSKRTLKKSFASRLAELDTTQNFQELQINDRLFS